MSKLKFSDGEEFDLSGELRVELRSDGYYVLGQGMMMAVDTFEEGQKYINKTPHLFAVGSPAVLFDGEIVYG